MRVHLIQQAAIPAEMVYDYNWILVDPEGLVRHGDVVHFPELMTGAGEFEGLFFASQPANGRVMLLGSDVETLTFPAALQGLAAMRGSTIQQSYERGIAALCQEVFEEDLEDVCGDADAVAAMWANPQLEMHTDARPQDHLVQIGECDHRILVEYDVGPAQA